MSATVLPFRRSRNFVPRVERPVVWTGRLTAALGPDCTAFERAMAAIEATFGSLAVINNYKIAVERAIARHPTSPYCSRYAKWASYMGRDINEALWMVEHYAQTGRVPWNRIAQPYDLQIMREMRLLMRWLRRRRTSSAAFGAMVDLCAGRDADHYAIFDAMAVRQ